MRVRKFKQRFCGEAKNILTDLLASGGRDGSICIWDVRTCLRNNDGKAH